MTTTDSNSPQDTPPLTTERWAYGGLRITSARKTAEAWIDQEGDGKELWFAATKGTRHIVGAIYEWKVERTGERAVCHGQAQYTGDRIPWDDARCQAWTVTDNAARTRRQRLRDEANDLKRDGIDQALAPLMSYAANCRTRDERDALIATVIRRIAANW